MTGASSPGPSVAVLRIWRGTELQTGRFDEFSVPFEDGESVLDGLVRLRCSVSPDLAFQFSCFNANVCKECIMTIDGSVGYACIAKLRSGPMTLEPAASRPLLRDLLTDAGGRRDGRERLARRGAAVNAGCG